MKKAKNLLALLLVLALLFQMLPISVFANDNAVAEHEQAELQNVSSASVEDASEAVENAQSNSNVIGELPGRRSESEKHFRTDDGSFIAVDYGIPVHFSTDNGETWEDIDNTLVLAEASTPTGEPSDNEKAPTKTYMSKNGFSTHSFACDLSSGFLFAAQSGNHGIQMSLADQTNSKNADSNLLETYNTAAKAEISYPDSDERVHPAKLGEADAQSNSGKSLDEQVTPTKLRADVAYRDVFEGVDLLYELYSYNVKETILIKEKRENYVFHFRMELGDLTPELKEDGSIELADKNGDIEYLIPAPYMFDANGAESTAVSYKIEQESANAWVLAVYADSEWVNAEDRMFPVSVDPTVYFAGNSTNQQIFSGYINSNSPKTHPADSSSYIRCGNYVNNGATAGRSIGLIYVNKLPSIPENCVVTTSMLKLFQTSYSNGNTGYYNYPRLYTSQITDSSFNSSAPESFINSLTWNNLSSKVTYGNGNTLETRTTIDYTKCKINTLGDHYFEITETTRQWYENTTNISRLLVLDDGHSSSLNTRATFSGYGHSSFGHQPQLVVFYRNTVGVEGYHDYHTQNIGRAGTASVNNFTMGLSLTVPVFSAPSQALPFGLALIYNSPLSNANFSSSNSLHTKSYTTSATGYGWKTSVQQTVTRILLTGNDGTNRSWLIYTDADGTEHYFQRKGQTADYEDEDGLGLTITVNNTDNPTTFTMKDKEKNTWTFLYGYLSSYEDNNGNVLYYAYNGNDYSPNNTNWKPSNSNTVYRVTSVWRKNSGVSSATKLVTLSYTNNRLSSVLDTAGRTTSFNYDANGNLSTITYPDGKTASYTYSNATVTDPQTGTTKTFHRLTKARDNEAQYEIRYTYWSAVAPRVKEIQEYSGAVGSETAGAIMRGYKSCATVTLFRYCGADNTLSTDDDIIVHYYFDNWGRTINAVTFDSDVSTMLGVSVGAYTQNSGINKDNNRMTHAAASGLQSANLLCNAGLEHATGLYSWTTSGNGAAAARTTSETSGTAEVTPRTGAYMMKLYLGNASAGKESCYQSVYLTAGDAYVFSGYVNTAAVSNTGTEGAYLSFRTSNGTDIPGASSRVLNYKTNTAVDSGWERLETTFKPTQSGTYQVAVNLSHMEKVILADDLQLEKATNVSGIQEDATASSVNLIQLGGFERPTATGASTAEVSQFWTFSMNGDNTAYTVTLEEDDDPNRGQVIRLHNEPDRNVRAKQNVILNAPANRTYLVSAWGKMPVGYTSDGTNMKYNNMTYERFFGIIAKIYYAGYSTPEYQYVAFNGALGGWQYTSGIIAPKEASRTVERIELNITGDLLDNDAYVDDVTLIQEPVQTYTYDSNGNLTDTTNTEGRTKSELDSNDRLKKYTAMNGVVYNLTYDGDSRQPETIVSDGVTTTYTYDEAGNVTNTKVQAPNNGIHLESGAEYDNTKNFQTKTTDANGNTSCSSYDASKGLLTSSTDPSGITTNYIYDAYNDRPVSTYQDETDKVYLYYQYDANGRLKQLNRKDYLGTVLTRQGYHLAYDTWGNNTSISVGSVSSDTSDSLNSSITLASYVYNVNGTLARMNFPNGQYVTYTYDKLDRLIGEVYHNSNASIQEEYRYVYNANGQLAKQYTVQNNAVTESYFFEYDSLGRLIRSREEGDTHLVQRTEHLYDNANRLTKQSWTIGNTPFAEEYTYNSRDGSLQSYSDALGGTVNNSYDALKRLSGQTVKNSSNTEVYHKTSNYWSGAETNQTTNLPYQWRYYKGNNELISGYTYTYTPEGNIKKIYDAQTGQLHAQYEYDSLNQLKKEQRYVGGALQTTVNYIYDTAGNVQSVAATGTGAGTQTYTYGNPAWSDLLTAFDGHAIAYEGQVYNASNDTVSGTVRSGNPITWYNGSDKEYYDLTWSHGRQLTYLEVWDPSIQTRIIFDYDMDGIRKSKTVEAITHNYITQNGKVIQESYGTTVLQFIYDTAGAPYALRYSADSGSNFTTYYYVLNLQGDVVGLLDDSGALIVKYDYDAWGKSLSVTNASGTEITSSTHIANINPLRYRGYYYDTETGFYYLQSRYYDPIVKRFINDDSFASTGQGFLGYNMFAYCNNNPATGADYTGNRPLVNLMVSDGPNAPDYDEQTQSLYSEMQQYGFIAPTRENKSVQITKGKHVRTKEERRKEELEGKMLQAFFSFGLCYLSDIADLAVDVFGTIEPDDSISVPTGEYQSYIIYLEYDIENSFGVAHCWERRYYILVSHPTGSGKFLYLYDFEGGTFS